MEENKGLQTEKKVTGLNAKTKMASRYTIEGNKRVYEFLDFDDNESGKWSVALSSECS